MPKLKQESLGALRAEARKALAKRSLDGSQTTVVIGMGTCGIAAGAQKTLAAFREEVKKNGLTDVVLQQTGCMGLCFSEPTVEVIVPGMPTIVYGKVSPDVARRIVRKHILGKLLINDHIYDKPSADIAGAASAAKA